MLTFNTVSASKDEGFSPAFSRATPDLLPAGVTELSDDQLTSVNGGEVIIVIILHTPLHGPGPSCPGYK